MILFHIFLLFQGDIVTGVDILVCMESRYCEQGKRVSGDPSGPVWPEAVDVAGLSLSELRERISARSPARCATTSTSSRPMTASRYWPSSASAAT